MSDPSPDPEPTDEEIQAWLRTPEGAAAMKACMQDIVAGKHGELTPEFVEMARIGVRKHEVAELVKLVRERVLAWAGRLAEEPHEWPENSRWAHTRALQDECKAIMDLMLELPEPYRTPLMKQMVPLEEQLEKIKRQVD